MHARNVLEFSESETRSLDLRIGTKTICACISIYLLEENNTQGKAKQSPLGVLICIRASDYVRLGAGGTVVCVHVKIERNMNPFTNVRTTSGC